MSQPLRGNPDTPQLTHTMVLVILVSTNAQDRVSALILKFCDAVTLCHSVKWFWLFDVSSVYLKHSHYLHLLSIKWCQKSLSKNHSYPKRLDPAAAAGGHKCNIYLVGPPKMMLRWGQPFSLEWVWSSKNSSGKAFTWKHFWWPGLPTPCMRQASRPCCCLPRPPQSGRRFTVPAREMLCFNVWQNLTQGLPASNGTGSDISHSLASL